MRHFNYTAEGSVVNTDKGRLRGFSMDGVHTFLGIPYAKAERFHQPVPADRWEGVRNASNYGFVCPIASNPLPASEVFMPHRFWPQNEDCLNLNVWTKTLEKNAKRPVMVWLHGGGWSDGSSIEQASYDGRNLADRGDVVVVSVNHRLNILGFLDMSSFGSEYENSVNAGIADIVAALEWVRDNIAEFGGDPENVTLFGQSGGGGKIIALMQSEAAAGLFKRAIIMSGVIATPDKGYVDHHRMVCGILRELGLGENDFKALETVPYDMLVRAYNKVHLEFIKEGVVNKWSPVENGWYAGDPMKVGFTGTARKIPLIVGSVFAEFADKKHLAEENSLTEEEKLGLLEKMYGESTGKIVGLFREAYPGKDLLDLYKLDTVLRPASLAFVNKRVEEAEADTYLYNFALDFDAMGGVPSYHCADIAFAFGNTELVPAADMPGVRERLEEQVLGAFVSFSYTGNPNHPGLGRWNAYNEDGTTMLFDRVSEGRQNVDKALLEAIDAVRPHKTMLMHSREKLKKAALSKAGREWSY